MNSDNIISTINTLFGNFFNSFDSSIYTALDNIAFIKTDILTSYSFEKIFGTSSTKGFLLIANSFLIGFILYYSIIYLLSSFNIVDQPCNLPSQFFFKILISGIIMNSSYFICDNIILFNSFISEAIRNLGQDILNINISFTSLINNLNKIISLEENSNNIFSIDGIIKLIFSFGFFSIIFSYSVRYIMIKVFVILSPISFLSLAHSNLSFLFKSWLKTFLSLLLVEQLSSIILIIMFAITYNSNDITTKLLLIGAMFALIKSNTFVRELIGGINTDISEGIYLLKSIIR